MNANGAQEQLSQKHRYRTYLASNLLFHHAAAESIGLGAVDYQASNLLELDGPLGNGELARRLGLSTGATTRLVDRLEAHGLVRRTTDADDRRRTVIAHTGVLPPRLEHALDLVREPIRETLDSLTADELRGVLRYFTAATDAYADATHALTDRRPLDSDHTGHGSP
ncbi:MarR family winged helix-turn-helix transcriptional regulator [Rhodococcus yananensis]|uniref:MarR family winged helix-turn-helix transcriptional regulator n=1 Tax=Rhodococcus yananensis TaxID=2879464 RepID=UPI003EB7AF53